MYSWPRATFSVAFCVFIPITLPSHPSLCVRLHVCVVNWFHFTGCVCVCAGVVTIAPNADSQTFVNGRLITEPEELRTGSRIILGNNHVFRFTNPEQGLSTYTYIVHW